MSLASFVPDAAQLGIDGEEGGYRQGSFMGLAGVLDEEERTAQR